MKYSKPFYRMLLSGCIAWGIIVRNVSAQSDTLSFMHVTDTHLIFDMGHYHSGIVAKRKHYAQGIKPLHNLLDSLSSGTDTRFVALTGDMIDFYSASTENGGVAAYQVERFAHLVSQYPVSVFLNPGNHDIASYYWKEGRMVSSQIPAGEARAAWIRNVPAFREGTYYSRVFSVGQTQYRLIFLDNGYNSAGESAPYLDTAQLQWLKDQLQQSDNDIEIVLMHIPFSERVSGNELYTVLSQHATLKLILAGHNHVNHVQSYNLPRGPLVQVQTAAFGRDPNHWRRIRLTPDSILVSGPGTKAPELIIPVKP